MDAPLRSSSSDRGSGRRLSILAPTQYPWSFNSPRASRHKIVRNNFLPFNYLSRHLEGVTVFPPRPGFDLLHAFNRIPLSRRPFIIGFESHLPRGFGMEGGRFFEWMTKQLVSDRCRSIVAISDFARHMFLLQHAGHPHQETLRRKLLVRYPSVVMPEPPDPAMRQPLSPMRLLFVGNHFARKGGLVALRLAERALAARFPVEIELVSRLEMGAVSWTDPSNPAFFEPYRPLLNLPNVRLHGSLPNGEVLKKIKNAHFVLLPTFGDTFGYSAIEGLMHGTPIIATSQCALPEFIHDGTNGILLDLPLNEKREWVLLGHPDRGSAKFAAAHAAEVERLAHSILPRLMAVAQQPQTHEAMVRAAYQSADFYFNSTEADIFWDRLYESTVDGVLADGEVGWEPRSFFVPQV